MTARVRLERFLEWPAPGVALLPLRQAGPSAAHLVTLARQWPELLDRSVLTGVYQALGPEKLALSLAGAQAVAEGGFDAVKPSALLLDFTPYGPFAALAMALGCQGPFWTLEAPWASGAVALRQALGDLERGRCERALVGSYLTAESRAWLLLLQPSAQGVAWGFPGGATLCAADPRPRVFTQDTLQDPHGLACLAAAMTHAQRGNRSAAWCPGPAGRGTLAEFT